MSIYLYLKTHNQTGLKYLGQTQKDPYEYKGSGKYWLRHLDKHGDDVSTEILYVASSMEDLQQVGMEYSEKWNIVESKEFANLIPENGDGAILPGDRNPMFGTPCTYKMTNDEIKSWKENLRKSWTPERRVAWSAKKTGRSLSEEHKQRISESNQGRIHSEHTRKKIAESNRGKKRSEETKQRMAASKSNISDETRTRMSQAHTGKKQAKQTCPHCGKTGGNAMKMYHFDKCKEKK